MSIRIPGYQKLCETLKEGDLLEIVNTSPYPRFLVLDSSFYNHQLIPNDIREFDPESFRLIPGESKFFIVEDVSLYEDLIPNGKEISFVNAMLRTSQFLERTLQFLDSQDELKPWERFIRLRDTDYRLWWISSRTFVSLSDDIRVKCLVNGKAI